MLFISSYEFQIQNLGLNLQLLFISLFYYYIKKLEILVECAVTYETPGQIK